LKKSYKKSGKNSMVSKSDKFRNANNNAQAVNDATTYGGGPLLDNFETCNNNNLGMGENGGEEADAANGGPSSNNTIDINE
jgi:hypothetical protein